jgi:hypothetical protein
MMVICYQPINSDISYETHSILETFQRAERTTQPAFPILLEKQTSDLEISQLLKTIDDILAEFDRPTCVTPYKNTFLKDFMQRVKN